MVQNNKEHLNQGADSLEKKNPENQQYREERNQAINEAKMLGHELAHKLEAHEHHREREETLAAMRQSDAPQISPENNSPEKNQLDEMFREIKTEDFKYPFFKNAFPRLVSILEGSRLGKNLFVDVGGLGVGGAESSLSVATLGRDLLVDTVKFVFHPKEEFQKTKQILEDTIV